MFVITIGEIGLSLHIDFAIKRLAFKFFGVPHAKLTQNSGINIDYTMKIKIVFSQKEKKII